MSPELKAEIKTFRKRLQKEVLPADLQPLIERVRFELNVLLNGGFEVEEMRLRTADDLAALAKALRSTG